MSTMFASQLISCPQVVELQHQLFNRLCHHVRLELFIVQRMQTCFLVDSYNQQIPAGVKVPAYAYQNVSV